MAELNGVPVTADELRALALTNYGHFTSMRVDGGRVRGLTLHMNRLVRDCRTVFDADLDPEYVLFLVRKATADQTGSFVIRVTIFDPELEMGHPGSKADPKVLVTSRPAAVLPLSPLRVQSAQFTRDLPQVKHIGLMGSLRHRRIAQLNGYDDAIFVDRDGFISEGVTWNCGFFDGDQIVWPQGDVLPGVTMDVLTEVHGPSVTARVNLNEVHGMEAAFATNTSIGVRPISAIDGRVFADEHPILGELQAKYLRFLGEAL
ncbi:branched-subunit amino acid aminotransferase/4-amino-4-deoxychorismate lyase [Catenulispora sp. GP43]|uniref:aminotransferase class IV family protein n=1 Tax=Catenulispora sp. GP43 TaxID=3156263 RepID=UPI003513F578